MTSAEIFERHGRTMDTAPRDGTVFQLYRGERYTIVHAYFLGGMFVDQDGIDLLGDTSMPNARWLPIHAGYWNTTDEPPKDGGRDCPPTYGDRTMKKTFENLVAKIEEQTGLKIGGFAKKPSGEWVIVDTTSKLHPMNKRKKI